VVGAGPLLLEAGPWTDSFGGQAAADPNHRSADGAADSPLRLQRSDKAPLTRGLALFALPLPNDVDVHGMDQHLEITSFLLCLSVVVAALLDVVVE